MKKKDYDAKKETKIEEASRNEVGQEDVLDLDSLLDVQGGQNDKDAANCGLGCFSGAVYQHDQTTHNDK